MNAILQQKELENQQKNQMVNPMMYQHVSPHPTIFRGRHRLQDSHEVFGLHSNSFLMSAGPYPPISTLHRERGRRPGRRPANQKCPEATLFQLDKNQAEEKNVDQHPGGASVNEKEADHEDRPAISADANTNKPHLATMDAELAGQSGTRLEQMESSQSRMTSEMNVNVQEKMLFQPLPLSTVPYIFQNSLLPPGGCL